MFTGCESGQSYGSWWFHLLRFAEKDKFQGRPGQSQDTVVIQERNDFNICFFFPLLSMLSGSWCVGFWSHAYSFQKWITPISSSDMRSLPNAVKIRENICFLSFLVHFCDVFLHMTNRPDWIFFFPPVHWRFFGPVLWHCCSRWDVFGMNFISFKQNQTLVWLWINENNNNHPKALWNTCKRFLSEGILKVF